MPSCWFTFVWSHASESEQNKVMCSPLWPLNSLHSIWTTEIFCLCLRSESSTPSSIVEKMNWNTHEIYYYNKHNAVERLDLELGSNTTEKFQNLLKNFKTHEAQPSEFSNFSVSFEIFPWCLKAKFQIPPLRRRMFVINTTTVLLQIYLIVYCSLCQSPQVLGWEVRWWVLF